MKNKKQNNNNNKKNLQRGHPFPTAADSIGAIGAEVGDGIPIQAPSAGQARIKSNEGALVGSHATASLGHAGIGVGRV